MTSLRQMRVTASPTESGDAKRAFLVSNLMRWMMENQMDEFFHEAELAANYYCENGLAVISVLVSPVGSRIITSTLTPPSSSVILDRQ